MLESSSRPMAPAVILALLWLAGCGGTPTGPSTMVDSGSWYSTGFKWPHDGNPYETDHFVIYSDAASTESRETLAEIGEELLTVLRLDFGITSDTLFRFPPGQEKIHIYAYRGHYPQEWGGWGYYGGLIIYSLDHPQRTSAGHTDMAVYVPVVKHELMHVVESLLKGDNDPRMVDVWLTEGIAEHVSGGTAGGNINDRYTLENRINAYGELNPIAMHLYQYPEIEGVIYNYYYPMFELAVRYLLDPAGAGGEKKNLRDLFLDARNGVDFGTALENHLGVDLVEYEAHFFELVREYLGSVD